MFTITVLTEKSQGWHSSTDPRKREIQVRREEAESIKQEMTDAERRRVMEHKDMNSDVSLRVVYYK